MRTKGKVPNLQVEEEKGGQGRISGERAFQKR